MKKKMAAVLCLYKIEHRMQICLSNPRIACSTDHVGNIPLREFYWVLSAIHVLIKAYPTIPLSDRNTTVP
jgi:hypothetical protein